MNTKELILVRHAKSSWEYDVDDADRPLKQRGVRDAHRVSEAVSQKLPDVQAVYSSHANRALHTCIIFMRELNLPLENLIISKQLYDFSGTSVRDFVNALDDTLEQVMVFGHNHAMTYITNTWGSNYVDNVPTSGLVYLTFEVGSWKEISFGTTKMMVFPKQLK